MVHVAWVLVIVLHVWMVLHVMVHMVMRMISHVVVGMISQDMVRMVNRVMHGVVNGMMYRMMYGMVDRMMDSVMYAMMNRIMNRMVMIRLSRECDTASYWSWVRCRYRCRQRHCCLMDRHVGISPSSRTLLDRLHRLSLERLQDRLNRLCKQLFISWGMQWQVFLRHNLVSHESISSRI